MKVFPEKLYNKVKTKLEDYSTYLIIGISIFLFISLSRNVGRIKRAQNEIKRVEQEVDNLVKENRDLEEKQAEMESEEYIEKEIRNKLNLAKEGEIVVVLPDDETLKKLAPKRIEEEQLPLVPNWKKWINMFM